MWAVSVCKMKGLPVDHTEDSSRESVGSDGLQFLAGFPATVTFLDRKTSTSFIFSKTNV